jgi:hypothetical protein
MTIEVRPAAVDAEALRCQISDKYTDVAKTPEKGFHFHTGKPLTLMLGYPEEVADSLPAGTVESSPAQAIHSRWALCDLVRQSLTSVVALGSTASSLLVRSVRTAV